MRRAAAWMSVCALVLGVNEARAGSGLEVVEPCAWPTAVGFTQTRCSGVLVHPNVVVSAASCLLPFEMPLGESLPGGSGRCDPEVDGTPCAAVGGCKRHPLYDAETGAYDVQYCIVIDGPQQIPPTPIAAGCELDGVQPGAEVVVAGFGAAAGSRAIKEAGMTLVAQVPEQGIVRIGGEGIGQCDSGDRGGPAFVQLDDGTWRAVAVFSQAETCGEPAAYTLLADVVDWIEESSGYDVTPCHDPDGSWRPGPDCGGFASMPGEPDGATWDTACQSEVSGPGQSCGPPFAPDDEPPEVRIVEPVDGQSVASPFDVLVEADDGSGSGVAAVWLRVDGSDHDPLNASPWVFGLGLAPGEHELVAVSEDLAGNVATSSVVTIVVDGESGDDGTAGSDTGADDDGLGFSDDAAACGCRSSRPIPIFLLTCLFLLRPRRTSTARC